MEYGQNIITESPGGYVIYPYTKGQNPELEYITSYFDKPRHSRIEYTGFINAQDKTFVTHSGINKAFLASSFPDYRFVTKELIKPKKAKEFYLDTDRFDLEDFRSHLRYECISQLLRWNNVRSFVRVQTGFGKTAISIEYMSLRGTKALINCYSSSVLKQYLNAFCEYTSIDKTRVTVLQSSNVFIKILNDEFDTNKYDIYICTPKLIRSFATKHGWKLLNFVFEKLGIGTRIVDEAHKHIRSTIFIDAYTSIPKTVYMSADLHKSKYVKNRQFVDIFKGIPIIEPKSQFAKDRKYINVGVVKYNTHPDMIDLESVKRRGEFTNYEFMRYEFKRGLIVDILMSKIDAAFNVEKEFETPHKMLILVSLIEHVDELYSKLMQKYGFKYSVGRYHGEVPQEEKDITLKSTIIVSTYQSFSVGVDVKDIRYVFSLDQVNEVDDNQASGRIRPLQQGLEGYYFMFVDMGFPYCAGKLQYRVKYLDRCGKAKTIKDIIVPPNFLYPQNG